MTGMASNELAVAGWVLVALFAAAIITLAVRSARQTRSMSDYAVGSVVFNPMFVGLSLAAGMTSTASFVIVPGLVGTFGWSGFITQSIVAPIAIIVSLILMTKGFRKYGTSVKANTVAQWISKRYNSEGYGLLFGFISLLLVAFIVMNCVALTKVLSKTLNVGELWVLVGVVVFIFGYMTLGGANSMVYTNAIQASIMILVATMLIGSGYEHFSNGVHGFLAELRAVDPVLGDLTNPGSYFYRDYFEMVFCNGVVGAALVCQPHILTRSLMLEKESDVNKFLATAAIVMVLFFLVIITGLYARLALPDFMDQGIKSDGLIAAYVVKEFPVWVSLILVLGLIAAGVSTLEGLIQAVSATISFDLLKPLFGRFYPDNNRDRFEIRLNRAVIIVLGLVTIAISWQQLSGAFSVIVLVLNGVLTYVGAAVVPVTFGTFFKSIPRAVPMTASITAIVVHWSIYLEVIPVSYMDAQVKNPTVAGAIAICASLVVGAAGLLVLRLIGTEVGEGLAGEQGSA